MVEVAISTSEVSSESSSSPPEHGLQVVAL